MDGTPLEMPQQRSEASSGRRTYLIAKRALDVGTSLAVIAVGTIPVAITCVAICVESPGKPLFRHERIGRNGKRFGMWKLRSMYADAEDDIKTYLTPTQLAEWENEHKVSDDPRITKIGRVLRKTSLDELPQFLNVLVGDMSVVGPRPITAKELKYLGEDADEVLALRPGITGYWQAYARNDATWESGKRKDMEMYYVRNVSFGLDAKIFLRTFSAVLGMTGR